jgi:hypothetical protein
MTSGKKIPCLDGLYFFMCYNLQVFLTILFEILQIKSVFGSVIAGTFQITFRAKMHANDIFLFFKNYF